MNFNRWNLPIVKSKKMKRVDYGTFENWKIQVHNKTANVTDAWLCITKFPIGYAVLLVVVLVSCCCALCLRKKIVHLWRTLSCKKWRSKKTKKTYDRDVEQGKSFWQKKGDSPGYTKVEQSEQKRDVADFGVQNIVAAPRLSIDSSTTGCYKCYKKKKKRRRKR